jgi:hypothetical protein
MKHGDIKKINTLSLQESENLWQGLINSKLFAPHKYRPHNHMWPMNMYPNTSIRPRTFTLTLSNTCQ